MPELHCLKGEVGQVVLNLIVNGAHAIESKRGKNNNDEKGHLRLRTYRDGDSLVLTVEDSGIGMSEDVLKKAFDPFFTPK
jgi:signal transduction histidine kinase